MRIISKPMKGSGSLAYFIQMRMSASHANPRNKRNPKYRPSHRPGAFRRHRNDMIFAVEIREGKWKIAGGEAALACIAWNLLTKFTTSA
jgi:hypothetical protein